MNHGPLDEVFSHPPELPAALAAQIRARIEHDTQAVKPLRSPLVYGLAACGIFAVVALLFAAALGFKGWRVLPSATAIEMSSLLCGLALASGAMVARSMRPPSGPLYSSLLTVLAIGAYEAMVLGSFRDYSMTLFMHKGLVCLALGVACAVVAALPVWLILRRGFIVNPAGAGALLGLLSGLAGVTALTLHCDTITAPHAGVWHAAVIVVCVLAGVVAGRISFRP